MGEEMWDGEVECWRGKECGRMDEEARVGLKVKIGTMG